MSVFPEFLEHIHDIGLYVPGHNYEEMYNIMVYNVTHNIISTNNFVYTYAQMNGLYDYLEELLLPDLELIPDSDPEPNTNNNLNLPINDVDIINDIYTNDQEPTQNQNQDNQYLLQLFNNYITTNNYTTNNQYLTNLNQNINYINNTNNTNMISNEFTYTNLVYYNNI
jgi:hypothetical protein